jgi:hypothetical protein
VEEEAPSAPIEQIEKKIQKRTKKAKMPESDKDAVTGGVEAEAKPKRQTKKKMDL